MLVLAEDGGDDGDEGGRKPTPLPAALLVCAALAIVLIVLVKVAM